MGQNKPHGEAKRQRIMPCPHRKFLQSYITVNGYRLGENLGPLMQSITGQKK